MKTAFKVEGLDSLNDTLSEMSKGLARGGDE